MAPQFNIDELHREWMHSHEEDSVNTLVYRSPDYDFPPARGREGLEFRPNGELRYGSPGPDDRRVWVTGTWSLAGESITMDLPGRGTERFTIQTLDPDKLILLAGR